MNIKARQLMGQIVDEIRSESFVAEYQSKATPEECIGLAVAHYFDWDSRIFYVLAEALEDANFHTEAAEVMEMKKKIEA